MNRICEEGLEGCPGFVFSVKETTQSGNIVTTLKKEAEMPNSDEDGKKKLALIIGIAVGVLFTIIILIIALYKFRSRDIYVLITLINTFIT
jgi:magnesium-transporting ATPase (P-type)